LEDERLRTVITLSTEWDNSARASQKPPLGDWNIWLILAGRGFGKTHTGARDAALFALKNPNTQVAVIVPTYSDLRRVAFGGPSGILEFIPKKLLLQGRGQGYNASSQEIRLFNGSKIIGFTATEPERLRGPQFHHAWCDEIAAWRYPEAFDQLMFGLRLGADPKCTITTTPKPTKLIKSLLKRKRTCVTRGTTFENKENLAETAIQQLEELYGGTRLGRQELYAEVLEDIEGALWSYLEIDDARVDKEALPEMSRVVVGIDPAVTNSENSDETGIIVAGRGVDDRFYILADRSIKASPDGWMRQAVDAFYLYDADQMIAEVNNGGDLVERLLRTIDTSVSYKKVTATRGKMVRAEPIAALYEQKRVSHAGKFDILETQMCEYAGEGKSPDRMDALVWALTELSRSSGRASWRIS
jgi:phage terminase large subunit-like protein